MPITDIEVPGSSLSLNVWKARIDSVPKLWERIGHEGEVFSLEGETPGLHDVDSNQKVLRGYYSSVIAFEVEHLVEWVGTKTLFKRVESCEFLATDGFVFMLGKGSQMKPLSHPVQPGASTCVMPSEMKDQNPLSPRLKS